MAPLYLILFMPIVTAKINIELYGTFHETDPNLKIYVTGSDISDISDEDMNIFGLTDDTLKLGVRKYFGKEPNDVFLKSPTPWGDLYQSLKWQHVMRILTATNGRILNITSKNKTIFQQTFENHGKKPITYNVGVTKSVENAVKSVWQNDRLSVIDDVSYDIDVDSAGTRTEFGYTSKWGHDTEQGCFINIGTPKLEISLKPFQVIISELQVTKVDVLFEVEYMSFLSGYIATNFATGYKGHQFWGLDIGAVMDKANLENMLQSKEKVEFTFYINSRMIVHDNDTGVKLIEVAY